MNLEIFFEKFDQLADAPDAVVKMRNLIMWCAFSGAFSAEERNQPMPEDWAGEGAPTLPAIPASWKWQRGCEVFDVIRGVSYKKNDASDSPVDGSFPVLRANNIGNGINFHGLVHVPRDNIRVEQFVRRGDILIAMSSGSKKLVGKAAPIVSDFVGSFGAFCGIIRNKSTIPDEVLARYFQSPQYTSWVTAAGRGIGINNLGRGDLDSLPVPTPPLAEQKRIVAKVDELMALCDQLEAQQQERESCHAAIAHASLARFADIPTPANLSFLFHDSYDISPADLRKTILTLAVQGKLVPRDPSEAPADVSFPTLAAASIESDGDLYPQHWMRVPLGSIGEWYGGGTPSKSRPEFWVGDVPWVSPKDMKVIQISDAQDHISNAAVENSSVKMIPRGSLLMVVRGMILARAFPVAITTREVTINQDMKALSPFAPDTKEFILLVLRALEADVLAAIEHSSHGTCKLRTETLQSFVIPFPPLAEQRRIISKLNQLMALTDALEAQLAASESIVTNLLSAVVGELSAHH